MCSASTTRPVSDATRIRSTDAGWWRQAVVYQIYPRSFADSDGNGLGDLRGVTSRIPYLASLGIDTVWLSPFYPSALGTSRRQRHRPLILDHTAREVSNWHR